MAQREISVPNNEMTAAIFGSFDRNVKRLEMAFSVRIFNRVGEADGNDHIVVDGLPADVDAASEAIRYLAGRRDAATIADCEFFNVRRYVVEGEMTLDNPGFLHILCLSGSGSVSGEPIAKGDGYYIPEGMDSVTLSSADKLEVLVSIV